MTYEEAVKKMEESRFKYIGTEEAGTVIYAVFVKNGEKIRIGPYTLDTSHCKSYMFFKDTLQAVITIMENLKENKIWN